MRYGALHYTDGRLIDWDNLVGGSDGVMLYFPYEKIVRYPLVSIGGGTPGVFAGDLINWYPGFTYDFYRPFETIVNQGPLDTFLVLRELLGRWTNMGDVAAEGTWNDVDEAMPATLVGTAFVDSNGLNVDGSASSHASIGTDLTAYSEISFSSAYKPSAFNAGKNYLIHREDQFALYVDGTSKKYGFELTTKGGVIDTGGVGTALELESETRAFVTFDTIAARLYVDGVLVHTVNTGLGGKILPATSEVTFGKNTTGKLCDLQLYGYAVGGFSIGLMGGFEFGIAPVFDVTLNFGQYGMQMSLSFRVSSGKKIYLHLSSSDIREFTGTGDWQYFENMDYDTWEPIFTGTQLTISGDVGDITGFQFMDSGVIGGDIAPCTSLTYFVADWGMDTASLQSFVDQIVANGIMNGTFETMGQSFDSTGLTALGWTVSSW